jgi:hypothetical protein
MRSTTRSRDLSARPSQTFSATVNASNSEKCWKTMAIPSSRASSGLRSATGLPSHSMLPESGCTAP